MTNQPAAPDPQRSAPHQAERAPTFTHEQIKFIVQGITLAMFLGALDQTIVATALSSIGRHFRNVEDLAWIVTAYLLTGTATSPLLGKLSDIHGRRVVLMGAIMVFIVGSVACALAPDMTSLILARAFQGLGGGGLIALAQTIIADIVSPRERGRYQGYIGAVFALSSIGGPVLGGFLTEQFHWSLIFWINVPLGALALALTWHALKSLPFRKRDHKLDSLGALLMMAAAVALLLALSWGGSRYDWFSAPIGGLVAASAVLWGLFALRMKQAPEPFLPLNILGNSVVRSATLAGSFSMATLVGLTIFMPLYFETLYHLSAVQAGMALIPMLTAVTVTAVSTGQALVRLTRYKFIPIVGQLTGIVSVLILAMWPDRLPLALVLVVQTFTGFGFGMVFPVSTVCMQNAVSGPQMGIATGAANFFRSLVAALVVAVLGAIVLGGLGGATGMSVEILARSASAADLAYAFRLVFIASALVLALGLWFIIVLEERPLRGPGAPGIEP